jgi:hypothetical protein
LEELVEQKYLSAMPDSPFTGELMRYYQDVLPPPDFVYESSGKHWMFQHVSCYVLGMGGQWWTMPSDQRAIYDQVQKSVRESFPVTGGTYLQLNGLIMLIVPPPEESSEPQS